MRIKKLNDQATEEQSMFDRNISDDQKSVEADPSELDGLPAGLHCPPHSPAPTAKIRITTDYPDALPVLSISPRVTLCAAACTRHSYSRVSQEPGRAHEPFEDTLRDRHASRLLQLGGLQRRRQDDRESGQNIADFISECQQRRPASRRAEFKMLLAEKQKTDPTPRKSATTKPGYYLGTGSPLAIQLRFAIGASVFSLRTSEAGHPGRSQRSVPRDFPAGAERSLVGSHGRDLDRSGQRQAHRAFLSRHASPAGKIQSCRDGAGPRWHSRQAIARGNSGLQLPCCQLQPIPV